jgi:hypothetical protein
LVALNQSDFKTMSPILEQLKQAHNLLINMGFQYQQPDIYIGKYQVIRLIVENQEIRIEF